MVGFLLTKNYDAACIEPKIFQLWQEAQAFKAGAGAKEGAEPYCVVLPPPNVTGSLHMGHALNSTIQDILVRFYRMNGRNVLWQPGMDHAGIATQMVVERELAKTNETNRRELGRTAFVEHVWEWKKKSGGIIAEQLRRLGASCDWSRERFTMDEGLSKAVVEVFVRLYKDGLIYKDKRLVNWDPQLHTAISDLEVQQKEIKGHLWYFRYPLEGKNFNPEDETSFVVIATTRPETLLGDVCIAVNPEDERYTSLIGKNVLLPLVGRKLQIVADEHADPSVGSGAVKITPAHDFNDFEVARRHGFKAINILKSTGHIWLSDNEDFLRGLTDCPSLQEVMRCLDGEERFQARKKLVQLAQEQGYLAKVEAHTHMVPHGDRSGVVLEPFITEQWYLDAKKLSRSAIEAVEQGKTRFIPENWVKTYYEWMHNIEPWCLSRQLWWGHQIPAWYGPDRKIFVEADLARAEEAAEQYYGEKVTLQREEDVLDTWFSSALWPFSTLGWPEKTPELGLYYPTQTLVTGFDIIFFWVARMMMLGLYVMGEVPFADVYVHALVRDKHGAKMSKSKGNVVDPLELMDIYGADALRFTLARMAAQGRDIKLDTTHIGACRNFATKLWNATRFAQLNGACYKASFSPQEVALPVNRWILSELSDLCKDVSAFIAEYKFNVAAGALYHFIWALLCDWYIELVKPILLGEQVQQREEVQHCLGYCLAQIYKLLHPFMPYITEELWASFICNNNDHTPLALSTWPDLTFSNQEAAADINWLIALLNAIRSARGEIHIPPSSLVDLQLWQPSVETQQAVERHKASLLRLGRLAKIFCSDVIPKSSVQLLVLGQTFFIPLEGVIDIAAERSRLQKELNKVIGERDKLKARLDNQQYVEKASAELVQQDRARLEDLLQKQAKLQAAFERL